MLHRAGGTLRGDCLRLREQQAATRRKAVTRRNPPALLFYETQTARSCITKNSAHVCLHLFLQQAHELREYDDEDQIDHRDADERHECLICPSLYVKGPLGDVLHADDVDDGGLFQEGDEFIAQGGKDVFDGLGNDDEPHGLDIGKSQAPACFGLSSVNGHDAAADDLGNVGAGVASEGKRCHQKRVGGTCHDDEVHDEELYHHGRSADDGHVQNAYLIEETQNSGVLVLLQHLIIGGSYHSNDDTNDRAEDKCQKRKFQRDTKALQQRLPAVSVNKCLCKICHQFVKKLFHE